MLQLQIVKEISGLELLGEELVFFRRYFENFDTNSDLSNNLVTSVTEDVNGLIWIGTYGGGLIAYENEEFKYFNTEDGLPDNRVYHLSTDSKGRTWIGMRDGLSYFENGMLVSLTHEEFPFRKIRGVMEATNGDIWISTYDEGLVIKNEEGFQQFTILEGLPSNTVISTVEANDGTIWIATYGGVAQFKENKFFVYDLNEGVPNNGVMDLLIDKSETVWISTFGGCSMV